MAANPKPSDQRVREATLKYVAKAADIVAARPLNTRTIVSMSEATKKQSSSTTCKK